MAFNPFHWFRKRQKVLLAGLAIFCMVLFVLQFGRGDVFERLMSVFGAKTKRDYTQVTQLYGRKVTVSDLGDLQAQREMAQIFMLSTLFPGQNAYLRDLQTNTLNKLDTVHQRALQNAVFHAQFASNPQFAAFVRPEDLLTDLRTVVSVRRMLVSEKKQDTADKLQGLARILETALWQRLARNDSYFGGSFGANGLLDFMVWREQADELGIILTDADVRKALNTEAMTEVFTGNEVEDARKLRDVFGHRYTHIDLPRLYQALRDEFRVRLAQESLLGFASGARAVQGTGLAGNDSGAFLTPAEFYDAYREARTAIRVAMLTVPVKNFVAKVEGTPSEAELRKLFDRYKEALPSPERDRPAFKEPRRIKVEWVTASADAPFYQKKAPEIVAQADALTRFLGSAVPEGGGGIPGAVHFALPQALDLRLAFEHEKYLQEHKSWWDSPEFLKDHPLYARGSKRPEDVAAAVGRALAAGGTGEPVLSAAAAFQTQAFAEEGLQAARVATLWASGWESAFLGPLSLQAAFTHNPVKPLADVRDQLAERARQRVLPEFAEGILKNFQKEVENRRGNPTEAAEWIAKNAVPEKGITGHGVTAEPRDAYEIGDDAALAALKNTYAFGTPPFTRQIAQRFADLFFNEKQKYNPQLFPTRGSEHIYWWLVDDRPARVPKFEEARARVEEAWRFQEARKLARKKAEAIAEEVKKRPESDQPEPFLRDLALKQGYEVFVPSGEMARLVVSPPAARADADTYYEPYRFDEKEIAYPRKDTVEQLLKLKVPGEAAVVADEPEKNYYVSVLLSRTEPTKEQFFRVYEKAARGSFMRDLLWDRFLREKQDKYRAELLKQLRRESGAPLDDDGDYVIDLDIRKRFESRGQGEVE